jgi:DNA-binding HxlR family transcriptional regulator
MALPSDYSRQSCSLARSLEIVGERWTLLIVRDAFHGVRRFGDFAAHLDIPRAVLTNRLKALVAEEVLDKVPGSGGHDEYVLTDKGTKLWPAVRELMSWGDEFYAPSGPRRILSHAVEGGRIGPDGRCEVCGELAAAGDTLIAPGPGFDRRRRRDDAVSAAFGAERRLLDPVRG